MMNVRIHYTDGTHDDCTWRLDVACPAHADHTVDSGEFGVTHIEILGVTR